MLDDLPVYYLFPVMDALNVASPMVPKDFAALNDFILSLPDRQIYHPYTKLERRTLSWTDYETRVFIRLNDYSAYFIKICPGQGASKCDGNSVDDT
jgi:hypothetical protein